MVDKVSLARTKLFPTTIYSFNSFLTPDQHEQMLDFIKDELKVNYTNVRTNEEIKFGLYQGKDDLHLQSCFKPLAEFVLLLSENIFKEEGYETPKLEITQMWANKQVDGSVHPPPTHSNNIHSGVYYLKATDKTSGTQFFDPRAQAKVLVPRRATHNIQNSSMYQIHSVTGEGVIFPAWLQHWVPSNTDERVTISWNILIRGEYGEPKTLQNASI